jgi:hypothetical protein
MMLKSATDKSTSPIAGSMLSARDSSPLAADAAGVAEALSMGSTGAANDRASYAARAGNAIAPPHTRDD